MLFLFFFTVSAIEVKATDSNSENDSIIQDYAISGKSINPLYKGIINETDIPEPEFPQITRKNGVLRKSSGNNERYTTIEAAAAYLRTCLVSREDKIAIYVDTSAPDFSGDIAEAFSSVWNKSTDITTVPTQGDYLLYQIGGYSWSFNGQAVFYYPLYYTDASQESDTDDMISQIINNLSLDGCSDEVKSARIYDYIARNVEYDYENSDYLIYTAYGALSRGKAVCQGYSVLYYRLALEAGLCSRIISGTGIDPSSGEGGAHAWNIVKLEDYYWNLDVTWDSGSPISHNYYLNNSASFTDMHIRGTYDDNDYSSAEFMALHPMGQGAKDYPESEKVAVSGVHFEQKNIVAASSESPVKFKAIIEPENAYNTNIRYSRISSTSDFDGYFGYDTAGNCYVYYSSSSGSITIRATSVDGGFNDTCTVTISSGAAITSQPVDTYANVGDTVYFELTATGATSYQWYYSQDAGKTWKASGMSGSTTNKLTIPVTATRIGQKYRCTVTGVNGDTVTSNVVTIKEKLAITKQPIDVTATVGETVNFTLTATGAKSYQWYYSQDAGKTWKVSGMSGSTTNKLTVPVTATRIGQKYRCTVTGVNGDTVTSNIVTIKEKLAITKQPIDVTSAVGETVNFTLTAIGAKSYQWYYSQDAGKTWKASGMSGSATNKLTVPVTATRIGQKYRCTVTGVNGETVTSNVVTIKEELAITKQPIDVTATVGETVNFTLTAIGAKSYQWYFSQDAGKTWKASGMSGSTTNKLTVPVTATRIGQKYRCTVTGANGDTATSNVVTIKEKLAITKQPIDVTAAVGETVNFTLTATGAGSYQWYYSQDTGKTWKASGMSGSTTNRLTIPVTATRIGQMYKCAVTGKEGDVITSNVVSINSKFRITRQPVDVYASIGDTIYFDIAADGASGYQWYFSKDGGNSWNVSGMAGSTTNRLTVQVIANRINQRYRCVVTSNNGDTLTSDAATILQTESMTILSPNLTGKENTSGLIEEGDETLTIIEQPIDATNADGNRAVFMLSATGAESYQWYFSEDGEEWSTIEDGDIVGSDSNRLEVPLDESMIKLSFRCEITGIDGTTILTDVVKIIAEEEVIDENVVSTEEKKLIDAESSLIPEESMDGIEQSDSEKADEEDNSGGSDGDVAQELPNDEAVSGDTEYADTENLSATGEGENEESTINGEEEFKME